MKDQALAYIMTLGIVAFVGGFLVGKGFYQAPPVALPIVPINWDPRTICDDALAQHQKATDACWARVIELLQQRR